MMRFDFNATTQKEATRYIYNRAIQLLKYGVQLVEIENYEEGVIAHFYYNEDKLSSKLNHYQAIYVLHQYRRENRPKVFGEESVYRKLFRTHQLPILTTPECKIEDYLNKVQLPYISLPIHTFPEYTLIESYYRDKCAKRSGVYYMNHIDEGLAILEWIGASEYAKRAYCLHPILQSDEDLIANLFLKFPNIDPAVLIMSMEYRAVANSYLSHVEDKNIAPLSKIKDVNDMLIADKVQNKKDYELFHKITHPRTVNLAKYFDTWLMSLGISNERYQQFVQMITVPFYQNNETPVKTSL